MANVRPPVVRLEFTVISSELTWPPLITRPVVPRLLPLCAVPKVTPTVPISLCATVAEPVTVSLSRVFGATAAAYVTVILGALKLTLEIDQFVAAPVALMLERLPPFITRPGVEELPRVRARSFAVVPVPNVSLA